MADENSTQPTTPNPMLRSLDVLLGTWQVSGGAANRAEISGQVTYEWMEGGFFFLQHVDLVHDGRKIKGIEIAGYDEASQAITSQYFGNDGIIYRYVWEMNDDTLIIWGGEKGSPARYVGKLSDDHNTLSGGWEWPGGGYESTSVRVK